LALLFSLKGTALLYQGEELGLPEADLRRDQLKDPVGDLYYPLHKGRDGCRVPMPWDATRLNLGFSTGTPWLPMSPDHAALAASIQDGEPDSTLNFTRGFLGVRRKSLALRRGEIAFREAPPPLLAFERCFEQERIVCVFNMSAQTVEYATDEGTTTLTIGGGDTHLEGNELALGPYGFWLAGF